MLLYTMAPQNRNLPNEFYQIPEPVSDTASIIVSGTYGEGRSPCILRPDGTRAWLLESEFNIEHTYRGKVGCKSIKINKAMLPKAPYVSGQLRQGQRYLVLLRPGREQAERLRTREGLRYWEALGEEEIITIVELK